jgi:7,8-dihydropterin-6-yl-methyl-4-(beta-D-ribofuranosyl)aminobenzene 5'-phosphate synthase
VLFDTGGSGNILLNNMSLLGINGSQIDSIVISHQHGDHINGLEAVAGLNEAAVYLPAAFSESVKALYRAQNRLKEVNGWTKIAQGIYLTGEIGGSIVEQALVVETAHGLVVVTGCAHPGIVEIVHQVRDHGEVYLVMGGFHLGENSTGQIQAVIDALKDLGVQKVAPSHCTGSLAIQLFHNAYGEDFLRSGVGAIFQP